MARKSVFSPEQRSQIVFLFGEHKSVKRVHWEFAKMYGLEHHPRSLPKVKAFKRVIDMFSSTGSVLPDTRKGETKEKKVRSEDNIERVRQEISRDKTVSIRNISQALDLSYGTVHKILRDDLNLYPYKSHLTNHLEPRHKRERREFCTWLLNKSEAFPSSVHFPELDQNDF